jgi:hypothetical protein
VIQSLLYHQYTVQECTTDCGLLLMLLRIFGEAMRVIKMPKTATRRLNKPTIASLDKLEVGRWAGWRGCIGAASVATKNVSKTRQDTHEAMLGRYDFDWSISTGVSWRMVKQMKLRACREKQYRLQKNSKRCAITVQ